ncbi:MAG: redoxin domain-containing protein [Nitrospirae bacterium]|nr:redoxin domain-containing protein [Nitrospirota bacterium]
MRSGFSFCFLFVILFCSPAYGLIQKGAAAPEFSLKDGDGKPANISEFMSGKVLVLLFWSTESEHSESALKRFDEFYRKYSSKGVNVVAVNVEHQNITPEDIKHIKKVLHNLDVSFTALIDEGLKTFAAYDVVAIPSTVVISGGKVLYELPGYPLTGVENMFDYLKNLAGDMPAHIHKTAHVPKPQAVSDASLAVEYIKKKSYEVAYPLLARAIEIDPAYVLSYIVLANLYSIENRKDAAEAVLRKAQSIAPGDPSVPAELGFLLARIGRFQEAFSFTERAVSIGDYPLASLYHAYVTSFKIDLNDGIKLFDAAYAEIKDKQQFHMIRAEMFELKSMLKNSSADYRKALELNLQASFE